MATKHRSWADYQVETFSKPAVERLQTRVRRRTLVVAGLADALGIVFACWIWPAAWWAWASMFVLLFPLVSLINMSVRGVTEIPLSHLDDRQAQIRMRSFHDAFPVAITIGVLSGIALGRWWLVDDLSPAGSVAFGAVLGTVGATLHKLPTVILAWRLPDEADDEDTL